MSESNVIRDKSFAFSLRTIEMYKILIAGGEYILAKQLLRSGTSIGANVREAINAQSRREFVAKMNIALKEANETEYWIELLLHSGIMDANDGCLYLGQCREVCRLLSAIIKTTNMNIARSLKAKA